ncbi:hypothetical protein ACEW7V_02865 [Areca yellow leaf disease phytoplasma]|uniref:hypothetical protein n=1 Tax=Areca yellow leaf disease phytoplasma TaxID=927614 RepID=UPI0035B50BFB
MFSDSKVLTEKTLAQIESLCDLAPLHNPANIISIKAFQKVLPKFFQVVVFDTSLFTAYARS